MGNVVASNQVTGGQTYNFAYSYNVAGSLSSETYPSGRVVTTSYDAANRPSTLSGVVQGQTTNYITGSSYWPHGATWWNAYGTGLTAVAGYNTRLQPYVIWAVLNNNYSQVLFGECLNWGSGNSHPECPAAWADGSNNGTLQKTLTYAGNVPGDYHSMPQTTQAFGYDTLNRLTWETDSGSWSRSFGYDQWGNMWVSGNSGVPLAGNTPSSNVYNAANNQINGQQYDAAGNHTSANGNALGYDAENHIVSVTEAPAFGGGSETIAYDGNGQRCRRQSPAALRPRTSMTPLGSWRPNIPTRRGMCLRVRRVI